jgi:hypothetical protein
MASAGTEPVALPKLDTAAAGVIGTVFMNINGKRSVPVGHLVGM